jgi:kynurenine formamidase
LFGPNDEIGSANRLGASQIQAAAAEIVDGTYFNLDYSLDAFDPPLSRKRTLPTHTIYSLRENQRDDLLDGFYLQGSTQIDGLRHRLDPLLGFYGGVEPADVRTDTDRLGIAHLSEHGLVGRGLLIDVEGWALNAGVPLNHATATAIPVDSLDKALAAQGSKLRAGDIVMLHTGWAAHYQSLSRDGREALAESRRCTGLEQSTELLRWIWDNEIAMIAADNLAVEVVPAVQDSPFRNDGDNGLAHQRLIAHLGMILGELWRLDDLVAHCRDDGRFECFVAAKPLTLPAGVGSPANAFAIK